MNLRQNESPWTVLAPAKLNLFLDVLGRRPDGYHELETLMVPVRLYDTLAFSATRPRGHGKPGPISLQVCDLQGPAAVPNAPVPTGPENLVVRALEMLRKASGCERGAHVRLTKRIPHAAGMGGGSSDAAAALQLANRGWGIHWGLDQLASLAAELGSDVPFFLSGGPAVCTGRGEQVESVRGTLPLHFVIVKPPTGLPTADVYRVWDDLHAADRGERHACRIYGLIAAMRRGEFRKIAQWMGNQLQAAAASLSPWLDRARIAFAQLDFVGHQLTGSGSAYFGVCRHAQHARRLASILRTRQLGTVFVTRSCR